MENHTHHESKAPETHAKTEHAHAQTTEQKITRDMTIGEVVQKYPSIVEVLLDHGIHCVGCGASYFETLEEGFAGHGISDEEIDSIVKELNDAIPAEVESQNSELIITEKAAEKVKDLMKRQNKEGMGIRVAVMAGGCAGYSYSFSFEDAEQAGDKLIDVGGVRFYIDPESLGHLRGAKIDFVDTLQGGGFKVSNPNAKHSCGCGQSFH